MTPAPALLATSVFEILAAEGFDGSYPTVARFLRDRRGPRFRRAQTVSVPIETAPGEECQFDWTDCRDWGRRWCLGELWCFGAILSWSRARLWWFTTSIDRNHTFEGLVRFFESVGGVPAIARTDRMGALGSSQGKRFKLHAPTLEFARSLAVEVRPCLPADAKRKGKVERPFRDVKERFLVECDALGPPASIDELNGRAARWVATRVHGRVHRSTAVAPAERLETEQRFLARLARTRFDTAYVQPRRVHIAIPLIEWRGVRYSVPAETLGQRVECRQPLDEQVLEVRWAGQLVARHPLAVSGADDVWNQAHRDTAVAAALAGRRGHLRVVGDTPPVELPAAPARQLDVGEDFAVAPIDLAARYTLDSEKAAR